MFILSSGKVRLRALFRPCSHYPVTITKVTSAAKQSSVAFTLTASIKEKNSLLQSFSMNSSLFTSLADDFNAFLEYISHSQQGQNTAFAQYE